MTGFLAAAVMQCITELLCIWPIPGALSIFVKVFVDKELGIAVGIAYWFTYSVGFSALIASAAQHLNYWSFRGPEVTVTVIYIAMPLTLMVFNTYDVGIYGWIEVVTGMLKLVFLGLIFLFLIAINAMTGLPDTVAHEQCYKRFRSRCSPEFIDADQRGARNAHISSK
ncbi:hypothetical protein CSPX01_13564 [Colletotrichum filicis]|nr:hypothetical protein CSPX01_13564 [Colletotrichum filicis]